MRLDLPWWFWIFYVLHYVVLYVGTGALAGLAVVALMLASRSETFAGWNRLDRLGAYLIGSIVGGSLNFAVVHFAFG